MLALRSIVGSATPIVIPATQIVGSATPIVIPATQIVIPAQAGNQRAAHRSSLRTAHSAIL